MHVKIFMPESNMDQETRRVRLAVLYEQVDKIILSRQDPLTGLLPASTATTVHGDYTHAWVRDNVYSILAVWGLALAYRKADHDEGRTYLLEQSVVKLMRGLLLAMMKQADKVERFKYSQSPKDALHAKYDTRSGESVVGDEQWGHLQLDATSLFLLCLAQMTASGLRIIFTYDEVNFIQNLVHYIAPAYRIQDYGIWERGNKLNHGLPEINASSVGMAKAALESLRDFDLFGSQGGQPSKLHVVPDAIARARITLETLLPRESDSKEVDAALLSVIGFPAFAVESPELVRRTRQEILEKLQGHYGCKRFLRDGHQTVIEDTSRLHYDAVELKQFENIESEWPLFFTYLWLDCLFRGDEVGAKHYSDLLEPLFVEKQGLRFLPELYYVPAGKIEDERLHPHSQMRCPNENVPLIWAQSLYLLGELLSAQLLHVSDIDPLGRRWRVNALRETNVHLVLLAEDDVTKACLLEKRIYAQTLDEIKPVQIRHAHELAAAFAHVGRNRNLKLSGRPRRRMRGLSTSQVFSLRGETMVFLPQFLSTRSFYLNLDNGLLVKQLKSELAYINRYWEQPGKPLLALMVNTSMLQHGGEQVMIELMEELQSGMCEGVSVRVGTLHELLPTSGRMRIDFLHDCTFSDSPLQARDLPCCVLDYDPDQSKPLSAAEDAELERLDSLGCALDRLQATNNLFEHMSLLATIHRLCRDDLEAGFDLRGQRCTLKMLLEEVYYLAGRDRRWSLVRWAAGLLGKYDEGLEDAVSEILVRQKQLSVGRGYSHRAIIHEPLGNVEIMRRIYEFGGDNPRECVLIQEIVLHLGMLIKAGPSLFDDMLTLRAGRLIVLLIGQIAHDRQLTQDEAFSYLLELSPYTIQNLLREVLMHYHQKIGDLAQMEALHTQFPTGGLRWMRFSAARDAELDRDWYDWRVANGDVNRLDDDFYAGLWQLLRHCTGIMLGDKLDRRNRLDSEILLSEMTPNERNFALRAEYLLTKIPSPEYRHLNTEVLSALIVILRANPALYIKGYLVLDVLIGHAVRLTWQEEHPDAGDYQEKTADAWAEFYRYPPHQVANATMEALAYLLGQQEEALETLAYS